MKTKTHYVTRPIWDAVLFAHPVCTPQLTVETHQHPKYCKAGSTYRKNHVICKNCRRTRIFRGVK